MRFAFALAVVATACTMVPSRAATIANAPSGLVNPDVSVDFGAYLFPNFTPITNQFSSQGVAFAGTSYFTNGGIFVNQGFLTSLAIPGMVTGPLTIYFSHPVSAATFLLQIVDSPTATFFAFLGSNLIETFTAPGDQVSPDDYYGFSGIAFDEIFVATGGDFVSANLAYDTTPVPASFPLLAAGLCALGLLGWRRKRPAFVSENVAFV